MESWRLVFRDAIAPTIAAESADALPALLAAVESDDPTLTQGSSTTPPPLLCVDDWPCECACAIGFAMWKGLKLTTVGEVVEWFSKILFDADCALGEPAGTRWFLNWFDDTPRPEMRRELAAELRFYLGQGPDPMVVPPPAFAVVREGCPF